VTGAADVRIRRATTDDADYLAGLVTDEEVAPFLAAARPATVPEIRDVIRHSESEPQDSGVFVIEVDGQRAGTMAFHRVNRRSRIASVEGLAVDPRHRGHRIADTAARLLQRHLLEELGFHRLQLEVYAFNERAIRHAERAGFVREGVRRKAYWRNDSWVDGVLFGLVAEDLLAESD
jgi:RimJ/RimL family protein N-acetyltransferase